MYEGRRPGGLTALAVLNFIFCGLGVILVLLFLVSVKMSPLAAGALEKQAKERAEREGTQGELTKDEEQAIAALRALEHISSSKLILHTSLSLCCSGLLLATGIAYLRQRRWGRLLANIYAAVSVATTLYDTTLIPRELGGGLRFESLMYFVWPLLTVVLVNTTFREDLRT